MSRRPALDDASKLAERNPGPRGEGSQPFRLDPLMNQLYKGIYSVKVSSAPVRTSRRNAVAGSVRVAGQRELGGRTVRPQARHAVAAHPQGPTASRRPNRSGGRVNGSARSPLEPASLRRPTRLWPRRAGCAFRLDVGCR